MTHILLLGAGFSRNWGGLLADEVFDSLIGLPEIRGDNYLKTLLWNSKMNGGFENALSAVQAAYIGDKKRYSDPLNRLQQAVSEVFQNMNQGFFELNDIEFQNHLDRMLRTYLFRFDAIFTLNQDVLLEHHYLRHLDLSGGQNWHGPQLPGLKRIPSHEEIHNPSWGQVSWEPIAPEEFQIRDRYQPLFKLHGSSNWKNSQGGELLIIGGDKSRAIQSHAVLAWYFEIFQEYLNQPECKLAVIGYSFKDSHINNVIIEAIENSGLEFFLIDSLGSDVVKHANPSFGGAIYAPNSLDDAFIKGLIGASQRNLSETFGNDSISHNNVMQFFNL